MKELIINRIEEIKKSEDGFSKSLMRWRNFDVWTVNGKLIHLSQITNWEQFSDEKLLNLFERILRQNSKNM